MSTDPEHGEQGPESPRPFSDDYYERDREIRALIAAGEHVYTLWPFPRSC